MRRPALLENRTQRHSTNRQRSKMDGPSELGQGPPTTTARKVLKKIDRVIIPLLFVTYMLNFMDKTVLSSAAVFGLRDDNVSSHAVLQRRCQN
jgi:hypothetical protein